MRSLLAIGVALAFGGCSFFTKGVVWSHSPEKTPKCENWVLVDVAATGLLVGALFLREGPKETADKSYDEARADHATDTVLIVGTGLITTVAALFGTYKWVRCRGAKRSHKRWLRTQPRPGPTSTSTGS